MDDVSPVMSARGERPRPAARRRARSIWRLAVLAPLSAALLVATADAGGADTSGPARVAAPAVPGSLPGTYYAIGVPLCPRPAKGHRTCFAMRRLIVSRGTAGARSFTVRATPSPGPAGGLTPAELASAYAYSTAGGTGQTVAIVDAFNDPNIVNDLGTFDAKYHLACTGCLKVVNQKGATTGLPPNDLSGWSVEESLDVEVVHSVCPNCHILLVETNDDTSANLDAGVDEAVALGAKIVSNSYGSPETGSTAADAAAYNHPGVVITAATGDDGWYGWDYINQFNTAAGSADAPAIYNTVVAVGGTSLNLTQSGRRASEAVWNDDGPQDAYGANLELEGATGGGCSKIYSAQPWQAHVPGYSATTCGTKRLAADVSAVADPLTGFDIFDSYDYTESGNPLNWVTIGGTSLSSPLVAAMWALAGGAAGASYPAVWLYGRLGTTALYDVTAGGSGYCDGETVGDCGLGNPNAAGDGMVDCDYTNETSPGTPAAGTAQCDAAPGYDGPSGVGTPSGLGALKPLQFSVISPPASAVINTAEPFSASGSKDPYPGATITKYLWNWGDGSAVGSGVSTTHDYTAAGTYTVTLSETDSYGLHASSAVKVTVAS